MQSDSPLSVFYYDLLLQVCPTVDTVVPDGVELVVDVRVIVSGRFSTGLLVCLCSVVITVCFFHAFMHYWLGCGGW